MAVSLTARASYNPNATSWTAPLPTGAAAADWVLIGVMGGGTPAITLTKPGTTVVAGQVIGTGWGLVAARQLDAADITAGTIAMTASSSQYANTVIVLAKGATGFAAPGTVYKRASSVATTTAPAATAATDTQQVVVVQLEKASSNPGSPTVAPATTLLAQNFQNAAAAPSSWAGSYQVAGTAADRTLTNPVASANALGVQVPVIAAPPPSGIAISLWDGAAEVPVTLAGVWDGTSIQPVASITTA